MAVVVSRACTPGHCDGQRALIRVCHGACGVGLVSACFAAVAYLATMKCRDTDHPVGVVIWFHSWPCPSWARCRGGLVSHDGHGLGPCVGHRRAEHCRAGLDDRGVAQRRCRHGDAFKYLGAVLALAIGWWGYGESMSTMSLAGMALVVASISANTVLKARRSASAT